MNELETIGWQREPGSPELNFGAPIRRALVHRSAISEVFITDIDHHSANHVLMGAQWPRWHVFYGANLAGTDSALMAETLRQAVIALSHTRGVPLNHQFLLPHMDITVTNPRLDGSRPAEVSVELTIRQIQGSSGIPSQLDVDARFVVAGTEIGQGNASARILGAAAYERYRSRRAPADALETTTQTGLLEPYIVGHHSIRNVLLGSLLGSQRWPLVVDQTHPIFFDHPLDHVPGMLLIEASRQALRASYGVPHADFSQFSADFFHIVEFGQDIEVVVPSSGVEPNRVAVEVIQGDRVVVGLKGLLTAAT
ncbi:ScbA/BarX family gamma-butyrolactone biosynthesis protein [Arthrobacter sp. GMC3]|uniref:ScbA/BarX family gamma-butyrolactone biosynthesis protein n=1 Tax=Arthrobacter sp. GMC3 TaxID=2058894 RepID=UPI000CE474C4|nr:ScbA/BarX family gamma-butyrolactone biosynthesis protein [Arthrobacter sp. GMC3]